MEYARIVDIHEWYRRDLIDWSRLNDNFDAVGIRAGVHVYKDELLEYFIEQCERINKPWFTYHIPGPDKWGVPVEHQAQLYMSWEGVTNGLMCGDLERPYTNNPDMVNADEAIRYMSVIGENPDNAIWYGNLNTVQVLAWPFALTRWRSWIATYYWDLTGKEFRRFERWLEVYKPETLPYWIQGTIYENSIFAWQLSSYGDALHYLSIAPSGIKEADLTLSTVEKEECMSIITRGNTIPPTPPEPGEPCNIAKMRCNAKKYQYIRSGHGTGYNVVGQIERNQIVDVLEPWSDKYGNVWGRIGDGEWVAIVYDDYPYMVSV